MGDSLREATTKLTRARDLLLTESQQAASQGDWRRAKTLMELAERTDQLAKDVSADSADELTAFKNERPEPVHAAVQAQAANVRSARGGYPKYFVRDDTLVKQGLQRDGHAVYEHAVPQERYDQILERLAQTADRPRNRPFSIDHIQHDLDCPRYMTYVVVSMLLSKGVLERARKGSYTFATPGTFADDAAAVWEELKGAEISS